MSTDKVGAIPFPHFKLHHMIASIQNNHATCLQSIFKWQLFSPAYFNKTFQLNLPTVFMATIYFIAGLEINGIKHRYHPYRWYMDAKR
ncbi:MAG: hypothetical protein ACXU7H_10410 [Burkholderiaceae bacterium]